MVSSAAMHGVTTAIVAFIFVCVIFPHLIRNRPQFYAALAFVIAVILLDGIGNIWDQRSAFRVFAYAMCGLFQIAAILLLFLSAGGLTWRQLGGDMARAIEVIRRGEEEKEIIIPLTGQQPRARPENDPSPSPRIEINDPAPPKKSDDESSLPLT